MGLAEPMAKDAKGKEGSDQALIRDLAGLLEETGLSEIEIEREGMRVRVARKITFEAPSKTVERPVANIDRLLALPHVQTVGEHDRFWSSYRVIAAEAQVRGNLVPDAHVVALMIEHGVRTIWTHDRDYRRFAGIEARDPFA